MHIVFTLQTIYAEQIGLKGEGNIINAIGEPETFTIQSLVRN